MTDEQRTTALVAGRDHDSAGGVALATFPLAYGGALIGYAVRTAPPRQLDEHGRPRPDMHVEGMFILLLATLLASVSHALVFAPARFFQLRHWRLRTVLLLQLIAVAGSLRALQSLEQKELAVFIGPAVVTVLVYGCAMLIARAERRSPLTRPE